MIHVFAGATRAGGARALEFQRGRCRRVPLGAAVQEAFKTIKDKKTGEILQLGVRGSSIRARSSVSPGPASQIAVLDIDKKHPEAHAWWAAHRADLMPTRVHRTRSGGLHLIYTDPGDGLKCAAGKIAKGVDVRAAGKYIVHWPSAGLPVLSGAHAPAPWPRWLTEALTAQNRPPPAAVRPSQPARRENAGGRALERAIGLANCMRGWTISACVTRWLADLIKGGLHMLSRAGDDAVMAAPNRDGKIDGRGHSHDRSPRFSAWPLDFLAEHFSEFG